MKGLARKPPREANVRLGNLADPVYSEVMKRRDFTRCLAVLSLVGCERPGTDLSADAPVDPNFTECTG